MLRRRSIGLDGAESELCDLSGRQMTTAQVERTLRVFDTAVTIDMSNNELDRLPMTIPPTLKTLDVSFNLIELIDGIERLQWLQELHLGFNRLADVSLLEFCPQLRRVNLTGNRLMNTRGIEALTFLEHLDLSDNLIEFADGFRALSLNQHLTHLTMRGNPVTIKTDFRVLVLDIIPSVLFLDEKKVRTTVKGQVQAKATGTATKSLSYCRIYDEKKQFMVRQTCRPSDRPAPLLVTELTERPTHCGGSSMFLRSPTSVVVPQDPTRYDYHCCTLTSSASSSPRTQYGQSIRNEAQHPHTPPANAQHLRTATPYMSLYDRVARASGIGASAKKHPRASAPELMPDPPVVSVPPQLPTSTTRTHHARAKEHSRRDVRHDSHYEHVKMKPHVSLSPPVAPHSITRHNNELSTNSTPYETEIRYGVPSVPPSQRPNMVTTAPTRTQMPASHLHLYPPSASTSPQPSHAGNLTQPWTLECPHQRAYASSPVQSPHHLSAPTQNQGGASQLNHHPSPTTIPTNCNARQKNVLNVIQNLIQHKKQTLATLDRQSSSDYVATVTSS